MYPSHGDSDLADDLSYDDEIGLQDHKECWQESHGAIRYLNHQLAYRAF